MSEYQLYEFQALDQALTDADLTYLQSLSSRVELTATSARFNYSYSDFRGDPVKVLESTLSGLATGRICRRL
ncbi:MAG: hypothetical protein AAGC54_01370 [Cyanobacteria bacterium P01_F01_bin.4]